VTKKIFTIIELVIVLAIVGALTALLVTYYLDSQQLSKMHTFEANIENIVKTLDIYRSNKVMSGVHSIVYPTSISDTEFKALFTQEPINPYTGKSMLSSASADSGIQYQSDGTSYSICIAQQDVDDINNNGRIDDPLPVTSYPACTSTPSSWWCDYYRTAARKPYP